MKNLRQLIEDANLLSLGLIENPDVIYDMERNLEGDEDEDEQNPYKGTGDVYPGKGPFMTWSTTDMNAQQQSDVIEFLREENASLWRRLLQVEEAMKGAFDDY